MTYVEARKEAAILLKDDANELAMLAHDDQWKALPHRAKVAIQREIQRLREIANTINPE